jgi:hypothetical protein
MRPATPPDGPDVDGLADQLAQGQLTGEEAQQAWVILQNTVVLPMIQRLEEELSCDTLGEVAEARLPQRLQRYRRHLGRFSRWLERTLVNLVRDEFRKSRRRGVYGIEDPAQLEDSRRGQVEDNAPRLDERLDQALTALRVTLSELDERPRARQQKTDYHAILLLELRLAMAARLRGHRDALRKVGQSRSSISAARLPWTANEDKREIQPGWPPLTTIWGVLAEELDRSDNLLTDDDIVRQLTSLPGVSGLTAVAWRQWRTRAIQAASEYLGAERWDRTVAGWL